MKDLDEFVICADITTRMALFAMAKSLTPEEIEKAFSEINSSLTIQDGYEAESLTPLADAYKKAALKISEAYSEE